MADKKSILKLLGLDSVANNIKSLVDARVEIFKHEIKEEFSKSLANILVSLLLLNLVIFSVLFISFGLSIYLGSILDNDYYGFFMVGGFYLILLLILILFKDKMGLKKIIENKINESFRVNDE